MARRITPARIALAVKAVTEACGGAAVVFDPDGRIRVVPSAPDPAVRPVDYQGEIRL